MIFEWDKTKEQRNIEKHGISFGRAATIFIGTILSYEDNRQDCGETRIQTIGRMIEEDTTIIILVAHTDRKGITRIISARPANKKERKRYNDYIQKHKEN